MKSTELHGMSDEQLGLTIRDLEKHLFQLRFQSATDRLETPSEIRKAKKLIARIHTERRRRELDALAKSGPEAPRASPTGRPRPTAPVSGGRSGRSPG